MPSSIEQMLPDNREWQQLCKAMKITVSLSAIIITAWKMGLWLAKVIVEQQLQERADTPVAWGTCSMCKTQLVSKGFVSRQMLTLIGVVEWKRRVGRCPHRCPGSRRYLSMLRWVSTLSTNLDRIDASRLSAGSVFTIRPYRSTAATTYRNHY